MKYIQRMAFIAAGLAVTVTAQAGSYIAAYSYKYQIPWLFDPVEGLIFTTGKKPRETAPECIARLGLVCPRDVDISQPGNLRNGTYGLSAAHSTSNNHSGVNDEAAVLPNNLRLYFIVETLENAIVSGGGVNPASVTQLQRVGVNWRGSSPSASIERYADMPGETGRVGLPMPLAGEVWEIDHNNVIYDALVIDGCGSVPVFPIDFSSQAMLDYDWDVVFAEFDAYDDSTLTPTGYWTFGYSMSVMDGNGAESVFHLSGRVVAECTNVESYGGY